MFARPPAALTRSGSTSTAGHRARGRLARLARPGRVRRAVAPLRVRLLPVLMGTPSFLARRSPASVRRELAQPAGRPGVLGALRGEAIERAGRAAVAWEVLNEPDAAFNGTPAEYAAMLTALRRAAPHARLVLAATSGLGARSWLAPARATHAYDLAAVHVRGAERSRSPTGRLAAALRVPLWVTEHGYRVTPPTSATRAPRREAAQAAYRARAARERRRGARLRDAARQPGRRMGVGGPPRRPSVRPALQAGGLGGRRPDAPRRLAGPAIVAAGSSAPRPLPPRSSPAGSSAP